MVERLIQVQETDNAALLRLGWGTGYDSQTVTDVLEEETFRAVLDTYRMGVGRPGRDLSRAPLDPPFAPKSRQVALTQGEKRVPLGWVKLEVGQPVDKYRTTKAPSRTRAE
jgi:CRISPR/Cas system CSM-associated protein Csm5 (group 7 of RAMP superfamily)